MGDFNAKVGEVRDEYIVGSFGLLERSEGGELLIDFCKSSDIFIINTWCKQKKMAWHAWTAPDQANLNQQLHTNNKKKKIQKQCKNCKSRPGIDCYSDSK